LLNLGQIGFFLLNWDRLKKIATIFLLGILLFNWFGYRLVIGYWQGRTTSELEAKLDVNDYDESQLLSVKIPVTHLAYYNTSPQFERVDGSVEINGIQYKYVKRRLFNDSLELLCLPDQGTMKLRACTNDFYGVANGLLTNSGKRHGAHNLPIKNLVVDPYVLAQDLTAGTALVVSAPVFVEYACYIPSLFPVMDERPPTPLV
jgi:hypothetical protein